MGIVLLSCVMHDAEMKTQIYSHNRHISVINYGRSCVSICYARPTIYSPSQPPPLPPYILHNSYECIGRHQFDPIYNKWALITANFAIIILAYREVMFP